MSWIGTEVALTSLTLYLIRRTIVLQRTPIIKTARRLWVTFIICTGLIFPRLCFCFSETWKCVVSFLFLQIPRLVQVMKVVYGDAQYNASKQPNWEMFAKKPTFVKVPVQGENECGHYTLKYVGCYDCEKIVENIWDYDVGFLLSFSLSVFGLLCILFFMCHDFL